jgi:hypothetical protein
MNNNKILHQDYYNQGSIEVKDFIRDWNLNFNLGNAIKYICRAGHKLPAHELKEKRTVEDLKKAVIYLQFEIEHLEEQIEYEEDPDLADDKYNEFVYNPHFVLRR